MEENTSGVKIALGFVEAALADDPQDPQKLVSAVALYDDMLRSRIAKRMSDPRDFPFRGEARELADVERYAARNAWTELADSLKSSPGDRTSLDEGLSAALPYLASELIWLAGVDLRESSAVGIEDTREHIDTMVSAVRSLVKLCTGTEETPGPDPETDTTPPSGSKHMLDLYRVIARMDLWLAEHDIPGTGSQENSTATGPSWITSRLLNAFLK